MTLESILEDPRTIRVVDYEFITMDEVAHAIPLEIQELYSGIPWGKMQGIRNVLVHEYFGLEEDILWRSVQEDILLLLVILERIIDPK